MNTKKHINDNEIKDLLAKKEKTVNKGQKVNRKVETYQKKVNDLQSELNQYAHEVQQIKDKIIPLIEERIKPDFELGEFEDVTVYLEKGKVVAEVFDHFEEAKEKLKENLRNQLQKNDGGADDSSE